MPIFFSQITQYILYPRDEPRGQASQQRTYSESDDEMNGEYIVAGLHLLRIGHGPAGRFITKVGLPLPCVGAAGRFFAEAGLPLLRIGHGPADRFITAAGLPLPLVSSNNARATRCAATLGSVGMRAAGGQVFRSIPESWIALIMQ